MSAAGSPLHGSDCDLFRRSRFLLIRSTRPADSRRSSRRLRISSPLSRHSRMSRASVKEIGRSEQAVGEQPPTSPSISAQSLSNSGGATTLTFCKKSPLQPALMKILTILIIFLGSFQPSRAAITVTIMPGLSGTSFSITQTEPNPIFALDSVTGGFVSGIPLADSAFNQDISILGFVGSFSPSLGNLTNLFDGSTRTINGFNFGLNANTGGSRPVLNLNSSIELASNQNHQIQISNTETSETGIDFSHFVLGTHVSNDQIFGTITTNVIPEPDFLALTSFGTLLFLVRRRRPLPRRKEAEQVGDGDAEEAV